MSAALAHPQAAPAEIRFSQVSKVFGSFRAVDDLNLEIGSGELVAILGKTGCGKSTMFNMIAGLLGPSSGEVTVKGHNPFRDFNWFKGKIAIVFQNDRLLPWRTAIQNVEFGLEMLDVPKAERQEKARHWLVRLGLGGHEDDYPHQLSGGMRQRVSIARAFATDSDILLCDEPFSALDEMTANRLREEFAALVHENNKTAVFITHSINEALQIGSRIVVLLRPAKIAMDQSLQRPMSDGVREEIRARIQAVLAG